MTWDAALTDYHAGRIGGAELACVYVAERVRRLSGPRWLQGPRRPALDPGPDAPALVRLFAEREMFQMPPAVGQALVAWSAGRRRVDLWFETPPARALLAAQARGRRVVSLLDDAVAPAGPKHTYGGGGLGFAVHDLCHLEKFADPAHHVGQVGLFAALEGAANDARWARVEAGLDARYAEDRDHVLADMNGSPVFLFVVLRNKVKLAVRRQLAAARGVACAAGALDAAEASAYAEATEVLLDALGLEAEVRAAAEALTSRHDEGGVAGRLSAWFEARGREALGAQG